MLWPKLKQTTQCWMYSSFTMPPLQLSVAIPNSRIISYSIKKKWPPRKNAFHVMSRTNSVNPKDIDDPLRVDSRCCLFHEACLLIHAILQSFLLVLLLLACLSYRLILKSEAVIMLLCNLDIKRGLCYGTHLIEMQLHKYVIDARILTGGPVLLQRI